MKGDEMRNVGPFHEKSRFGVPIFLFAVILLLASATQAATVTVTTTVDENDNSCGDGDCSLRDAVATANPGDVVAVPAGTYGLTLGEISVAKQLTIQGAGARVTVVNGNANSRIFRIPSSIGNPTVTIADITITNGDSSPDNDTEGGGVRNEGTVILRNCTISNNISINGGGVFSTGTLTVDRCTVSGNTSRRAEGGGVRNLIGTATIVNSTISGNTIQGSGLGGGVANELGGSLSLINSTITQNTAGISGGLQSSGSINIFNTIIAQNSAPSECTISGSVSSHNSLASDNTCSLAGPGDLPNTSPGLDPLANNGGPTDTHALQAASEAVDAGDDATCAAAPVNGIDQRGVTRPQGAHCDIGAFELVQNQAPDCSGAGPSVATLWPPNHKMIQVSIQGVTDPDGDPVSIEIDQIRQDEPTNGLGDGNTCPDGQGIGTATASVRAERSALANGRVYTISFTASDGEGGTCQGSVKVCVPHDRHGSCVNGGPTVDSTACGGGLLSTPSTLHTHRELDGLLGILCFSHAPTLDCDLLCDVGALLCL